LNGISTVIYLAALMNLAYSAGQNLDHLLAAFKQFQFFLLAGALALAIYGLLRNKTKRPITS